MPVDLLEVRTGPVRAYTGAGGPWRSAIGKQPATGPVLLTRLGLDGDTVGDPEVHGGPEQAALAYASEHYPLWRAEGVEAGPGGFGENFLLRGLTDAQACIGDVYAIGPARVQISHPRQPCHTLVRHLGRKDIIARVWTLCRGGWYLRVLEEGRVQAGMLWDLLERPNPEGTVARVLVALRNAAQAPDEARAMARLAGLSPSWAMRLGQPQA